ncbi:hypothetical protein CK203_025149 [Vitis vinifera]|uniref:RNase H type-1 domain-containing protein n=1 Tax=Vitis vinifera TaxID=29760 RepID=A0A438JF55_VITVI|nr:hypothetical protein CK203_025149 [Vitis vinifera]
MQSVPSSLQGQALSWFHRLPPNSVGNFRDLSEAFAWQYLCSARHKQNISTLQNIKMQDNESLREFVKRFGQVVLQVEACSMNAILKIFKRSICPGTPFFESLAKKPPTTMDDLFRRANKYSMLEDDVHAATQQVLVVGRPSRGDAERNAKPLDRPRQAEEVWHEAESFQMRLWRKCWQISGFMVSQRGIEVSPDQVKAVMETPPPRSKKELQRLTGKLVALGRFIARFIDELRPFFLAIRKAGTSGWTDNCQNAFEKIKHCLMQPPILSSPIPKEKLYMYLAVSEWAISVVLFRCPSPKEQKPIYYVSRALADVETMLNQHQESNEKEWWTLRVDGASRSSGSGVGLLLQSLTEEHLEQAIRLGFPASNNEAEYEAILSGLDLALALSVTKLRVYSDSQLVIRHVQKEYEAKDARMTRYLTKVKDTLQRFTEWTIEKIKRTENRHVDALAGIATSLPIKEAILLPIHVQTNPSVAETSTCNTIEARQADDQE